MDTKIVIGLFILLSCVGLGYFYFLSDGNPPEQHQKLINISYIGEISGYCECYLEHDIGDSPEYSGLVAGYFYGDIVYNGSKKTVNVTIINGDFTGVMYGEYGKRNINGTILGRGNFELYGILYIEESERQAFSIPIWIYVVGVIIFLCIGYKYGFIPLDLLSSFIEKYKIPDEDRIEKKIREWLRDEIGIHILYTLDVIRIPEIRPEKIFFVMCSTSQELIIVPYERGKIQMPRRNATYIDIIKLKKLATTYKPEIGKKGIEEIAKEIRSRMPPTT